MLAGGTAVDPLLAHVSGSPVFSELDIQYTDVGHRLVVMSFNIWWVMSVVIGAGVGETMFGRFGSGVGH